jgi:hypothetical protein
MKEKKTSNRQSANQSKLFLGVKLSVEMKIILIKKK